MREQRNAPRLPPESVDQATSTDDFNLAYTDFLLLLDKITELRTKAGVQGTTEVYRGNEGQNEAAAAAHFAVVGAVLHMLPQQSCILLMHAHYLLYQHRLPCMHTCISVPRPEVQRKIDLAHSSCAHMSQSHGKPGLLPVQHR